MASWNTELAIDRSKVFHTGVERVFNAAVAVAAVETANGNGDVLVTLPIQYEDVPGAERTDDIDFPRVAIAAADLVDHVLTLHAQTRQESD